MSDVNGRPAGTHAVPVTDDPELAEIEAKIERTREELADTVDQLAAKLDVKSRVRDEVAHTRQTALHRARALRDRATGPDGKPTPTAISAAGGVLAATAAVVVVWLWLHRRH